MGEVAKRNEVRQTNIKVLIIWKQNLCQPYIFNMHFVTADNWKMSCFDLHPVFGAQNSTGERTWWMLSNSETADTSLKTNKLKQIKSMGQFVNVSYHKLYSKLEHLQCLGLHNHV